MAYLVFMNYIMLVAICGHMGIVVGDTTWLILDILGVVALLIGYGQGFVIITYGRLEVALYVHAIANAVVGIGHHKLVFVARERGEAQEPTTGIVVVLPIIIGIPHIVVG